jgi:hypothetical protein
VAEAGGLGDAGLPEDGAKHEPVEVADDGALERHAGGRAVPQQLAQHVGALRAEGDEVQHMVEVSGVVVGGEEALPVCFAHFGADDVGRCAFLGRTPAPDLLQLFHHGRHCELLWLRCNRRHSIHPRCCCNSQHRCHCRPVPHCSDARDAHFPPLHCPQAQLVAWLLVPPPARFHKQVV